MEILKYTYTIPFYGNKHINPYGKIKILYNNKIYIKNYEETKLIKINRKDFKIINKGGLYSPDLKIIEL